MSHASSCTPWRENQLLYCACVLKRLSQDATASKAGPTTGDDSAAGATELLSHDQSLSLTHTHSGPPSSGDADLGPPGSYNAATPAAGGSELSSPGGMVTAQVVEGARMCQVPGCTVDLTADYDTAKATHRRVPYHVRFRLCQAHVKADATMIQGVPQRWCQKCSRFHQLSSFDGLQRTCALQLRLQRERNKRRIASTGGHSGRRRRTGDADGSSEAVEEGPSGDGDSTKAASDIAEPTPQQQQQAAAAETQRAPAAYLDALDLDNLDSFLLQDPHLASGLWPMGLDVDTTALGLASNDGHALLTHQHGDLAVELRTAHVKLHGDVTPLHLDASLGPSLMGWMGISCVDGLISARPGCTWLTLHALVLQQRRGHPSSNEPEADMLLERMAAATASLAAPGGPLTGLTVCDPAGRLAATHRTRISSAEHVMRDGLPRMQPAAIQVPLTQPLALCSITRGMTNGRVVLFCGGRAVEPVAGTQTMAGSPVQLTVTPEALPRSDGVLLMQLQQADGSDGDSATPAFAVGPVRACVLCSDAAVVREVATLSEESDGIAHEATLLIGYALTSGAPPLVTELAARVAAARGWTATLARLLQDLQASATVPRRGVDTLLHCAVRSGSVSCVAQVKATCPELKADHAGHGGLTPMHVAASLARAAQREPMLNALCCTSATGDDSAHSAWLTCPDDSGSTPEQVYFRTVAAEQRTHSLMAWLPVRVPGSFADPLQETAWLAHVAHLRRFTDAVAYPLAGLGHLAQAVSVSRRGFGQPPMVNVLYIVAQLTFVPMYMSLAPASFARNREVIHIAMRTWGSCVLPLWVHRPQRGHAGVSHVQHFMTLLSMAGFSMLTIIRAPLHVATQIGTFGITIGLLGITDLVWLRVLVAALNLCVVISLERSSRRRFAATWQAQKIKKSQ